MKERWWNQNPNKKVSNVFILLKSTSGFKLNQTINVTFPNHLQICEEDEEDSGGISIHNIGGVFIVIFVGIFLALITLGFEYFYYKNKTPSRVQSAEIKVSEFNKDVKKGF